MKLFRNIFLRAKKPEAKNETIKATRICKIAGPPMLVLSGNKQCRRCLQVKPLEAFYLATASKDGRQSYCKACQKRKAQSLKLKKSNIEKRAADRAAGVSKIITVKLIPAHLYDRLKEICGRRGCTQQDLFIDMIKTYLILHEKSSGA